MPERPRIVLLHATLVAVRPVEDALARLWPDAETTNLLDDGLTSERARTVQLEQQLIDRFGRLVGYADSTKPDGILITCSAFGPAIDRAVTSTSTPIVKPNEAMFSAALQAGPRTGMVATFEPSVATMTEEYEALAAKQRPGAALRTVVADGAMAALRAGDTATHDELVAQAAEQLSDCDALVLAHFSTARAAALIATHTSQPVYTAPDSAVSELQRRVQTLRSRSVTCQ